MADEKKTEGTEEGKESPEQGAGAGESAVARLTEELEARAKEAAGNHDKFLRKCADLENYKRRMEKELSSVVQFANEDLIKEILPIVDSLERALEHRGEEPGEAAASSLIGGVDLTLRKMSDILKKFGVEEIRAEGGRFDPARHEALSHEEKEGFESGAVIKELQKGYILRDRLLRPSLVIVAK
ncbi:MAG: nucleotide exchange factor GrpE [Deltaproteobacteria bacterium]|nr:nucleotide exchange factor GrpE [Deltaproteobacteria bacterium]